MKKKEKVITTILLIFILILYLGIIFCKNTFTFLSFNSFLFTINSGIGESDLSIYIKAFTTMMPLLVLFLVILYTLFFDITFGKKEIKTKKGKQLYPIKFINNHRISIMVILIIIGIIGVLNMLGFTNYVYYSNQKSKLIEKEYVEPIDKVKFDEKRNLILIMVESLETSYFTKEQEAYWDYELVPELYNLMNDKNSISFYNRNEVEGINMIEGSSWTTASIVSNLSGIPIKVQGIEKTYKEDHFYNNAYSLGDLLKDNNYHNEIISAARTSFGGLKEYFSIHGDYSIIDEDSIAKYGLKMTKKDKGKWGFNDKYLFETAKKRLDIISKEEKPFNLELITIDTHFIDGFVGDYSTTKYDKQYENAYATESKLIGDFIEYLKKQSYYKDTTVVIVGDHLTMQKDMFKNKNIDKHYVYNCIINSPRKTTNNKNRIATALDYYPTIVYSIGGNIKGDRLALGTNLYSKEKTIGEKYGFNKMSRELNKKSDFYNRRF